MVACLVRDQEAVGSNPATPTIRKRVAIAALFCFVRRDLKRRERSGRKQSGGLFSPTWACSCDSSVANPATPTIFRKSYLSINKLINKTFLFFLIRLILPQATAENASQINPRMTEQYYRVTVCGLGRVTTALYETSTDSSLFDCRISGFAFTKAKVYIKNPIKFPGLP